MLSKDRVYSALSHCRPDRVPVNAELVGEAWEKLYAHFATHDREKILREMEVDCRVFYPAYSGKRFFQYDADKRYVGYGGSIFRCVQNTFGSYSEVEKYALAGTEDISRAAEKYSLPCADEFNYQETEEYLKKCSDTFNILGASDVFLTLSNSMNMQEIFINFYENEDLLHHLIKMTADNHLEIKGRILEKCAKNLDGFMLADDFATQRGPLISLEMFRKFFKPQIKRLVDLGKSYGLKIYMHCCGSCYAFIPEYISLGVDILDPIQTTAADMQPEKLKAEFGNKLTFHGGVDSQRILPSGSVQDVRENIQYLTQTLGADGGYILASCHYVQADVPLENILELYRKENRYF